MPRRCTVCGDAQLKKIDEQLITGVPYRSIAKQFGVSDSAVYRHKEHIDCTLIKAKEAEEVARADDLLEQVRGLQERALKILSKAEEEGDLRTALTAIREARGNLELLARLLGELKEGQTINILFAPEWIELRTVILRTLEPHPEARLSLAAALEKLENGNK